MFGLRRKAAPNITRTWPQDGPWHDETIRANERLRGRWMSRNPEAAELLAHAIGVANIYAWTNATACTSAVLRLYKRAGAVQGTRNVKPPIGPKTPQGKRMARGRYGRKIAEFTQGGAEMQEVVTHPILDFLSKPNPMFPGEQLTMQRWFVQWVTGNAYDKIEFAGSSPLAVWPLYSQFVQVKVSDDDEVVYVYGRSETERGQYTANEVVHYKLRPSPHTPLYGMGALDGVLPYSDLITDTLVHDVNLAKNGMRPDAIMSFPEGTTDDQVDEFERKARGRFGGPGRAFRWLHIVGAGFNFTPVTFPEKELMSKEKVEHAEKIIQKAFGIPDSMAEGNDSTYASALVGYDDQYLGGVIEPALIMDAAQLNTRLLPMFGLDPDVYALAYDPLVTKDEKVENEMLRLDTAGGILTINEARVERGLEKIDDEMADKLLFNGVPLGGAPQADPFGGLLGGFGQSRGSQGGQEASEGEAAAQGQAVAEGEESEPEPKAFDIKSVLNTHESELWKPCDCCTGTKDDDIAGSAALRSALEKYSGKVESLSRDVLTDMQDEVRDAIVNNRTPNLQPNIEQAASEYQKALKGAVEFGVTNILENSDGRLGGFSVPDEAFNIAPERALRFLEAYSFELAGEIAKTTRDMTETAVRNGLEQGLSIDKIADEMSGFPEYRARAIARTEVSRAMNAGAREGMVAVGVEKHKVLTAPGVRKSHAAIAAQGAIPIDEPFVKAGDTFGGETFPREIAVPPFGVNCRCGIMAVYEEGE